MCDGPTGLKRYLGKLLSSRAMYPQEEPAHSPYNPILDLSFGKAAARIRWCTIATVTWRLSCFRRTKLGGGGRTGRDDATFDEQGALLAPNVVGRGKANNFYM